MGLPDRLQDIERGAALIPATVPHGGFFFSVAKHTLLCYSLLMNERSKFVFVLGRERELALAEIEAVLNRFGLEFSLYSRNGVLASFEIEASLPQIREVQSLLGGTLKIYRIVQDLQGDVEARILGAVKDKAEGSKGKLEYGISSYDPKFNKVKVNELGLSVKKELKSRFSLRFIALREDSLIPSIISAKRRLADEGLEIGIFDCSVYGSNEVRTFKCQSSRSSALNDICLGILVASSNPEEWSRRDYGKPAGDKYSGMVPPKLAREMVNIALGLQSQNSKIETRKTKQILNSKEKNSKLFSDFEISASNFHHCVVADPFCGSGNILMEAMMLGCDVVGSDKSEKAVRDTEANLRWLIENFSFNILHFTFNDSLNHLSNEKINDKCKMKNEKFLVFQADATKNDFALTLNTKYQSPNTVLVTEPYLGEPKKFKPSLNAARGEYGKVKELYLSFLSNIKRSFLCQSERSEESQKQSKREHPSALSQGDKPVLCIVFPLVETTEGKRFSLWKESVDEIVKIGYTELRSPFYYGRDYQIVKREIVFLRLN